MKKTPSEFAFFTSKLSLGVPVIFPTDTLPALGITPEHSNKLWEIKQRPRNKPLILMASNKKQLFDFVSPKVRNQANIIADKYWPGPLTLVLPSIGKEVRLLNNSSQTIGMRIPGNELALKFLKVTGPLATTSANISGYMPVSSEEEALKIFPELPILGSQDWTDCSGIASTVIKLTDDNKWKILRKGDVIPTNISFE